MASLPSRYLAARTALNTAIASEFGSDLAALKVSGAEVSPETVATAAEWALPDGKVLVICCPNGPITILGRRPLDASDMDASETQAREQQKRIAYDLYVRKDGDLSGLADLIEEATRRLLNAVEATRAAHPFRGSEQWTVEWAGASDPRPIGDPYAGCRVPVDLHIHE